MAPDARMMTHRQNSSVEKGRDALRRDVVLSSESGPCDFKLVAEPCGSRLCCLLRITALFLLCCVSWMSGYDSFDSYTLAYNSRVTANNTEWFDSDTTVTGRQALLEAVISKASAQADVSVKQYEHMLDILSANDSAADLLKRLNGSGLLDERQKATLHALELREARSGYKAIARLQNSIGNRVFGVGSNIEDDWNIDAGSRKLTVVDSDSTSVSHQQSGIPSMNLHIILDKLKRVWLLQFSVRPVLKRKMFCFFFILVAVAGMMSLTGCMIPGFQRGNGGRRNHSHVGDAGPPYVGTATLKVPPAWSAERAHWYSLRSWLSDLILWSAATDLEGARQGPVAALQISGAARDLVREIPPNVLQNGRIDPQTGAHTSGLMVLAETLIQRYAPLDAEVATRSVSELINIRKMQGESTDAFLVRFDVLRNRAANRGGMAVNFSGLSWILLNALGLAPDQWERLLFHNEGRMPANGDEFNQLMERIRRTGHMYEGHMNHRTHHQGATGDTGLYFHQPENGPGSAYFPTFSSEWPSTGSSSNPFAPAAQSPFVESQAFVGTAHMPSQDAHVSQAAGLERIVSGHASQSFVSSADDEWCQACGMYFEDDEFSSATDSDDGAIDPDAASSYQYISIDGHTRSDDCALGNAIYLDYLVAKRRWRRFSGKPPRRYRRFTTRHDIRHKQRSRLSRGPYAQTFASFLPPNAFAGGQGKGKGKGKGKGFRKNPKGKDGRVLLVVLTHIYGDYALSLRVQAMARAARRHPWQC